MSSVSTGKGEDSSDGLAAWWAWAAPLSHFASSGASRVPMSRDHTFEPSTLISLISMRGITCSAWRCR